MTDPFRSLAPSPLRARRSPGRRALALGSLLALAACHGEERFDPTASRVVAETMREYLGARVSEPERRTMLLALVDRYERQALALDAVQQSFLAEVAVHNARVDATRAELRGLLERALAARRPLDEAILDTFLALRELTTEEEWGELVGFERRALHLCLRRERKASRPSTGLLQEYEG